MATRHVEDLQDHHAALHRGFGWQVSSRFNIAQACCGRWAAQAGAARRVAIREHLAGKGPGRQWSYLQLQQAANRLSRVLSRQGVRRGDRVAIVMPQRFETAVAYVAILQMGAVAMPLSMLFGPEALAFRLQDGRAVLVVAAGDARIDNGKFKQTFGKGKMLPADEVVALTGHPVGGVCPFGLATDLPVYLDASLRAWDEMLPAAGSIDSAVRIAPQLMASLTGGEWVDVCQAAAGTPA